ncbi:MAG: hypothetical protein JSR24_16280 [Proteobacteria bacterium]|nr:hypothetical protein [Pseudomonadota bacterium]
MERTITGHFSTRKEADLAVEHVVQEHGIPRPDIFIQPLGADNSAGSKSTPAAHGDIEVSVDCHDIDKARAVKLAFEQTGGHEIRMY